jgi:hypothetical protein
MAGVDIRKTGYRKISDGVFAEMAFAGVLILSF